MVIKKIMLNSPEHEILNAHRYNSVKKIQHFSRSDKLRMLLFMLIEPEILTANK